MYRHPNKSTLVVAAVLAAFLCALHPLTSSADEAADIARILELNDAYGEATRAWRAKEITRSKTQELHKAIQAEGRRINSSYGKTGTPERRAWDRKVQAAKNARTKQKRKDVQAARAEASARQREAVAAEKAKVAAAAEQRAIAAMEAEARLTAELRTQMQEDQIDSSTGWINYGDVDPATRERQVELVQKWNSSNQAVRFTELLWEHFIALLRERSAMTTAQRRPGTEPFGGEGAINEAAARDESAWVAAQPRAAQVIAMYPGDDPESAARRAVALGLVVQSFVSAPGWGRQTLKATLLNQEYLFEIFKHDQLFPTGSDERRTYDQAKLAFRSNGDFVREVAEAFQPHEVERMDFAADWRKTRARSVEIGEASSYAVVVLLTLGYIVWALVSIFRDFRGGGFVAQEVDGRLDVSYSCSKHGILALLAAVLLWGFLVTIWALMMPTEEPQWMQNAVLRDPRNAGWHVFWGYSIIFGMPAAGLLLLNLLRMGKKQFSITSAALIIKNKTFVFGPEQAYYVQAAYTGPERTVAQGTGGVYFIGSGPAVGAALAGQALGGAMRAGQQAAQGIGRLLAVAIARARFSIRFTHEGGDSELAKGLSRKRANAILDCIGNYLDAERVEAPAE